MLMVSSAVPLIFNGFVDTVTSHRGRTNQGRRHRADMRTTFFRRDSRANPGVVNLARIRSHGRCVQPDGGS